MINALHDSIDTAEDLREEALKVIEEVNTHVREISKNAKNFEDIFDDLAVLLEAKLAGLTTKAVQAGQSDAKKIVVAARR